MVRGGGKAAGAAKKPRAPKGGKAYKLAEPFPSGEVLKDNFKKEWRLGNIIGQGGFGLIYLASQNSSSSVDVTADFVIKIEPLSNGPLFCEMHFYQRVAQPSKVDEFKKSRKLKYLGVPKFIGNGLHERNGQQYRFLVMERFGKDVQKIFEESGRRFERHTVCCLALRMIDALEFIHSKDYVHADIKAANILLGYKAGCQQVNQVYLVDYGLAVKYLLGGSHVPYKEDPKRAHDGTVEYASIDAHKGVGPARRGDLEILGYCCLQWLSSKLPWDDKLGNKDLVANSKIQYHKDIKKLMRDCFPDGSIPEEMTKYFEAIKKLNYDQEPEYDALRGIFRNALKKYGWKDEWNLDLPLSGPSSSPKKTVKRKSTGEPAAKVKKLKASEKALPGTSDSPGPSHLKPKTQKKTATPRRSPAKQLKSPPSRVKEVQVARAARSAKSPQTQDIKRLPEVNGGTHTPVSKGSNRRVVRRRRVKMTDACMQTSPQVS